MNHERSHSSVCSLPADHQGSDKHQREAVLHFSITHCLKFWDKTFDSWDEAPERTWPGPLVP